MREPNRFDTPVITPELPAADLRCNPDGFLTAASQLDLFLHTTQFALDILNCGEAYSCESGCAMVLHESHMTYMRPVDDSAAVRGTFRLLAVDQSRFLVYQELYHRDGWRIATMEAVLLHMDIKTGRGAKFPQEIVDDATTMLRYHGSLPKPKYRSRHLSLM